MDQPHFEFQRSLQELRDALQELEIAAWEYQAYCRTQIMKRDMERQAIDPFRKRDRAIAPNYPKEQSRSLWNNIAAVFGRLFKRWVARKRD